MTEKVKITQEQADAIEKLKKNHRRDFDRYYKGNIETVAPWARPLADLSVDEYMSVLYDGYEIEPEFKVGDWVARLDDGSFYPKGEVKVVEVLSVRKYGDELTRVMHGENQAWGTPIVHLRHATPEEIANEKENRLWKSFGW